MSVASAAQFETSWEADELAHRSTREHPADYLVGLDTATPILAGASQSDG